MNGRKAMEINNMKTVPASLFAMYSKSVQENSCYGIKKYHTPNRKPAIPRQRKQPKTLKPSVDQNSSKDNSTLSTLPPITVLNLNDSRHLSPETTNDENSISSLGSKSASHDFQSSDCSITIKEDRPRLSDSPHTDIDSNSKVNSLIHESSHHILKSIESNQFKITLESYDSIKSGHPYEDGALVFQNHHGLFAMVCDGVSGCESKDTPNYVKHLMNSIKKEILTLNDFTFNKSTLKYLLEKSLKSYPSIPNQNSPSTTLSLVYIDSTNKLHALIIGDSHIALNRFQPDENDEKIEYFDGILDPQINWNELFQLSQVEPSQVDGSVLAPIPQQISLEHGIDDSFFIDGHTMYTTQLLPNDQLIIASDGVWDNFQPNDLFHSFNNNLDHFKRKNREFDNEEPFWFNVLSHWSYEQSKFYISQLHNGIITQKEQIESEESYFKEIRNVYNHFLKPYYVHMNEMVRKKKLPKYDDVTQLKLLIKDPTLNDSQLSDYIDTIGTN